VRANLTSLLEEPALSLSFPECEIPFDGSKVITESSVEVLEVFVSLRALTLSTVTL
jgi:hypothetical protein